MNLQKVVKGLLPFVVPVTVFYAGCTGLNFYKHHNLNHVTVDGTRKCSKADGIFDRTKIIFYKDGGVHISRPDKTYSDTNGDGKVDEVTCYSGFFSRGPPYEDFSRTKHLEQYPHIFQEADKEFKEQMERFKDFCK